MAQPVVKSWTPLVLLLAMGCGGSPPIHDPRWEANDAVAVEGPLQIRGHESWIDGSQLALVTWPEFGAVPSEVQVTPASPTDGPSPYGQYDDSVATIIPTAPLEARWYAVRRIAPASSGSTSVSPRMIGSIPMADGSEMWRVFGAPVAQLYRVFEYHEEVVLEFTLDVHLQSGWARSDAIQLSQDGAVCNPLPGDSGQLIGQRLAVHCVPVLDWTKSMRLQVDGLLSTGSVPFTPLDVTFEVTSEADHEYFPPSTLLPPMVPPDLCAGVNCRSS